MPGQRLQRLPRPPRPSSIAFGALVACTCLGPLLTGCSRDPKAAKEKYLASGDRYAASGKTAEAVIEYQNAVQQDPGAGDAHGKLAEAYLKAGSGAKAVEEYVRAADLLPEDQAAHLKASGVLLLAGRFDDAKLWAGKVLERDPKNVQAQILLANALAGLKDLDAAVAEIEEAIQLEPDRGSTYSNLGALELGRGQKDAAERAFKKAVALDDKSAPAHLALANFYWVDARWAEAESELLRVLEIEPANILARRVIASFYIATNRAAEAEPHLKEVRNLAKTPAADFALADYYIGRNDEAAARGILEPLAGAPATAALAEVKLAALDRKAGQSDRAFERIGRVLEKDKTNLNALLLQSDWMASDGRLENALSSASLAAEKHPDSASALYVLGRVQAARHQTDAAITAFNSVLRVNPRATDAKLALAGLHLASGRASTSAGLAQEVIASDPKNDQARLIAVRALLAQKDLKRAQVELDALMARLPDSAAVHVQMGILEGLKRNDGAARKQFERAMELEPGSVEALSGLVALNLSAKRPIDARNLVDERLAKSPKDPALLMLSAQTYSMTGDKTQAEALLRRLIDADPSYLNAYGALAQLYMSQKRLDAALAEFEQLAQRQPRPIAALTFAGMILQGQGKAKEARDHYERVLQIDPEAPVAANNLAWMYTEMPDKLDAALELAMRARAKLPDQSEVNDTVGWAHFKKDRAAEAIPYFAKSIEKDASNPTYQYHMGLACGKTGDVPCARKALARALELKPDFPEAADAKRALASLPQ